MTEHEDVDRLERELAARLGAPLMDMRARRTHCPPVDVLRASAADVLDPDRRAALDEHLRVCALCRTLAADLQDDELTAPTAAAERRMRARVDAHGRTPAIAWLWIWRPTLAAAALAGVAWFVWTPPRSEPETTVVSATPVPPAIANALPLEMPEPRLRTSVALVTRGAGDAQRYLSDVAPAFNAYRAADYATAAREFSALESVHGNAIEVLFYGGVSSLQQGALLAALQSLERAQALNEPEFADDVRWYLGMAYQRAGDAARAREQFVSLCGGRGSFADRACDAVERLGK